MWRRVASQSPTEVQAGEDSQPYLTAWEALGKMIALGRSLSGHERNCCFLNLKSESFANVSAASGFDFPADGRGLALTDWDGDGRLDMWLTNRTAPRLQFLKNDYENDHHSVSIRLIGKNCNRDAIGARVIVVDAQDSSQKLFKTLRAGEGYLSQSTKWLHFGLGTDAESVHLKVNWPDGTENVFRDLPVDTRYTIEQHGDAKPQPKRAQVRIVPTDYALPIEKAEKRAK